MRAIYQFFVVIPQRNMEAFQAHLLALRGKQDVRLIRTGSGYLANTRNQDQWIDVIYCTLETRGEKEDSEAVYDYLHKVNPSKFENRWMIINRGEFIPY